MLLDRKISQKKVALEIGKVLPIAFAFTINMGVAPLLFLQVLYGHLFYTSSILMAWYWISLIVILIGAYYSLYAFASSLKKIFLFITCMSVLFTAFMFVNNMTMMIQPTLFTQYFKNTFGTLLNLKDPTLLPRYLHMITGAISLSYLFLAVFAKFKNYEIEYMSVCLKRFLVVSLFQILWGVALILTLPSYIAINLLTEFHYASFLILGVLCAFLAMIYAHKERLWNTSIFAFLTLVFMVITRHNVRTLYLDPYFDVSKLKVFHQTFNLFLFLGIFVVGLIIVGYLLKISFKKRI